MSATEPYSMRKTLLSTIALCVSGGLTESEASLRNALASKRKDPSIDSGYCWPLIPIDDVEVY